jgi:hypothetical protein
MRESSVYVQYSHMFFQIILISCWFNSEDVGRTDMEALNANPRDSDEQYPLGIFLWTLHSHVLKPHLLLSLTQSILSPSDVLKLVYLKSLSMSFVLYYPSLSWVFTNFLVNISAHFGFHLQTLKVDF